jgi:hypothetical protein
MDSHYFKYDKFGNLFFFTIFYLNYIPCCVLAGLGGITLEVLFLTFLYYLILHLSFQLLSNLEIKAKIKINYSLINILNIIFFTLSLVCIMYIFIFYSQRKLIFSLSEVYNFRTYYSNLEKPYFLEYLHGFANICIPTYLIYYFKKNKKFTVMLILIVQYCNFSIAGHKDILFITLLSILFIIFFKRTVLSQKIPLFIGFVFIVFIIHLFGNNILISYFIRRLCFVTNLINSFKVDYFKTHDPYYYMSLFRFIGYNYTRVSVDAIIGIEYFNDHQMMANSGLLGDAITNFGVYGIFITPFFISTTLVVFNKITKNLSIELIFIPCVYYAIILMNSSFFTTLFSHGFIGLFFVFILIASADKKEKNFTKNIFPPELLIQTKKSKLLE